MDEQKKETTEEKKPEESTSNPDEGGESETDKKVKSLNADTERINIAIAENENAKARQKLGGVTEAGQQPVKKEMSDVEYAQKARSGELNLEKKE